jgi:hypothetical protein
VSGLGLVDEKHKVSEDTRCTVACSDTVGLSLDPIEWLETSLRRGCFDAQHAFCGKRSVECGIQRHFRVIDNARFEAGSVVQ